MPPAPRERPGGVAHHERSVIGVSHRTVIHRYFPLDGVDPYECVYCGEPAEHIDHVLPVRYSNWRDGLTPEERAQLVTVPSCAECNQLAGSRAFRSLIEKRDYIRDRIRRRYAKVLNGPVWTADETAELGDGLRSYVEGKQARRHLTVWRLSHDGIPADVASACPIADEPMPCGLCSELAWCITIDLDGILVLACETCVSSREVVLGHEIA